MSYEPKTKWTGESVVEFIETVESKTKKQDAYILLDRFAEVTKLTPKMWGPSIIGYGKYRYTYKSGHSGEAPIVGFSPRKANFSLYLSIDPDKREELLSKLGKHRTSKACVYVNKLADIDLDVLDEMILDTVRLVSEEHEIIEGE